MSSTTNNNECCFCNKSSECNKICDICKICDLCYEKIKIGMLPLCNNCTDRDCLKCFVHDTCTDEEKEVLRHQNTQEWLRRNGIRRM
jgi:hypothetical protein